MRLSRQNVRFKLLIAGALLTLPVGLIAVPGGAQAAPVHAAAATGTATAAKVTSASLGTFRPTFTGPAATGCASGCDLLTGPTVTPSTRSFRLGPDGKPAAAAVSAVNAARPNMAKVSAGELARGTAILAGLPKP
jgi:hypothetical protein